MSYTYAICEVSSATYAEIRAKLKDAGYDHAFHHEGEHEVIDMHGVGLRRLPVEPPKSSPALVVEPPVPDVEGGRWFWHVSVTLQRPGMPDLKLRSDVRDWSREKAEALSRELSASLERVGMPELVARIEAKERADQAVGGEEPRFKDLPLDSRIDVVYERLVDAHPVVDAGSDVLANVSRPGWYAILDAEGDLVCLVPPGGAVDELNREILDARVSVLVAVLNQASR